MTPTPTRSTARKSPGSTPPSTNWNRNNPSSANASRTVIDRFVSTATAKADWAAVRKSSSRWSESIGRPCNAPAEIANTIGSDPTRSVHWFTFADTSVPRPAFVFNRHANKPATSSSGASDASGASHCTSRNVSRPNCSPVSTSDCANGSAEARITPAAARSITMTTVRRRAVGRSPINWAGPTRCGSSAGARLIRMAYSTNSVMSTAASNKASVRFSGSVSE